MPEAPSILIVCTANICRSPMAEGLLRHALAAQPEPLRSVKVLSAGVSARDGLPATEHTLSALKKVGIELTGHRSRLLTPDLGNRCKVILCMTEAHRQIARRIVSEDVDIRLFREFAPGKGDKDVADPYGGDRALYEATRDEMVEAIPPLIEYLKKVIT